ncbi:MAG: DUF4118 domain-containing protein [Sphingomonadales bacterium]|nr:DUF4118 domain-containing protein [Sphingomonadales bacterium]
MGFQGGPTRRMQAIARLVRQGPRHSAGALLLFTGILTLATTGSIIAQRTAHPATAALILMVGIIINGAVGGLAVGLITGATGAFIYNFFIRFPVYQLGFNSIDDAVPLVAFCAAAVISGVLSGRLKDRARAAEELSSQLDLLLTFSARLQRAIRIEDVVLALRRAAPLETVNARILPYLEERHAALLTPKWRAAIAGPGENYVNGSQVVLQAEGVYLGAVADLLAMAIERYELLDHRAEAEVIRRSEAFKTALLSSLSHDLRTPIAAIAAAASGLDKYGELLDSEARSDLLDTIQSQCNLLDRFTAKLLSLGQLQQGLPASDMEIVDVADALGSAIARIRALQPDRPITKSLKIDAALVLANPAMLEQVFFNLIENAVNYTDADTPVRISLDTTADMTEIRITDEGHGIAAEDLPHIFERFFRSASSREKAGQGLGLSIAKGFIEAFGGNICAISPVALGGGTQILIRLPLAKEVPAHG